ncbi:MAG: hypothetical protein AB8F95_11500 [Bacteroidia bacterium]
MAKYKKKCCKKYKKKAKACKKCPLMACQKGQKILLVATLGKKAAKQALIAA